MNKSCRFCVAGQRLCYTCSHKKWEKFFLYYGIKVAVVGLAIISMVFYLIYKGAGY